MDQPTPPIADSTRFDAALRLTFEKLSEIESRLMLIAVSSGTSFCYQSKSDAETPIVAKIHPRTGLEVRHRSAQDWYAANSAPIQLRMALALESPRMCVQAVEFYAWLSTLTESSVRHHLLVMDHAIAILTRPPQENARGVEGLVDIPGLVPAGR